MIIGYGRASTSKQLITIEDQRQKIKDYATFNGMADVEFIADEATTSKTPLCERPGGSELCKRIKSGEVKVLIISAFDRAFRKVQEALDHMEDWDKRSIEVHILDIGGQAMNISSATGRMVFTMMATIAEWERRRIAERTKDALGFLKAKNRVVTREDSIPYGYKIVSGEMGKKNALLGKCDKEMHVVGIIKGWHADGMSYNGIARKLNEGEIKPRTAVKWYASVIRNVVLRDYEDAVA